LSGPITNLKLKLAPVGTKVFSMYTSSGKTNFWVKQSNGRWKSDKTGIEYTSFGTEGLKWTP
jgi:hypothetical protein